MSGSAGAARAVGNAEKQNVGKGKTRGKGRTRTGKSAVAYVRGSAKLDDASTYRNESDKKLRARMKRAQGDIKAAAHDAARVDDVISNRHDAGVLEADGELERTYKFSQREMRSAVDQQTQQRMFDLSLEALGPYNTAFSRNGAFLLLAGRRGHVAMIDWRESKQLACEFHVQETIRDVVFLHNETMFATAQQKHCFIYDKQGTELHCLKKHVDVNRLDFLAYHMLLTTVGNAGFLKYQDVSTGDLVSEINTKMGACDAMKQNPWNACMSLGHHNGVVTMWSPTQHKPLVKMLCHKGAISAVAHDHLGRYLVTSGAADGLVKVWDVRTYKELHSYVSRPPPRTLAVSQRGMLAIGTEYGVQVWQNALEQKQQSPYVKWATPVHGLDSSAGAAATALSASHGRRAGQPSTVRSVAFCPFEDVLGVGHSAGFSSVLVPGSGEPNYDAFEANPYATVKQRREQEVKQLLDKLQPGMISLDPDFIGTVDRTPKEVQAATKAIERKANLAAGNGKKEKNRARGRQKIGRRLKRKQANVWDEKRKVMEEQREQRQKRNRGAKISEMRDAGVSSVLNRFAPKE